MTSPTDSGIVPKGQPKTPGERPMLLNALEFSSRTAHLTTTEVGGLFLIMAHVHQAGGSLPLDFNNLAALVGVTPQRFETVWDAIASILDVDTKAQTVRLPVGMCK